MAEQLLLRKGLYADLDSTSIIPGAISITTDEPGIYLDLAEYNNDGTVKTGSAKRVRIGDFISFPSLKDLQDSAHDNYGKDSEYAYSEHALYYAQKENILCKYDPVSKKFIWINDTTALKTELQGKIDTINGNITTINTDITTINNTIGSKTSNHAATKDKTVFKAIEDEYDRATGVESNLQGQINAIKGNGDGSIGALEAAVTALQEDLAEEKEVRAEADTTLSNALDAVKGANWVAGTDLTVKGASDAIAEINSKIGSSADESTASTIYGAIKTEAKTRAEADQAINKTITDLKNGSTSTLKSIDEAIAELSQQNTTINNSISALDERLTDAEDEIDALQEQVGAENDTASATGSLYARIKQEILDRSAGDSTLQTNINNLAQTVALNKTELEGAITSAVAAEAALRENADTQIRTDFVAADKELKEYINTLFASADAMTFKGIVTYKPNGQDLNLPTGEEETITKEDGTTETVRNLIKAGDTYVVSSERSGVDHNYHAGDMIIAIRDQLDTETSYPSKVVAYSDNIDSTCGWYLIETGYNEIHESKLSVETRTFEEADVDKKQDPIIKLTSHTGTALGSTRFTSESDNIEINHTANQNGVISFNLVWATF